MRDTLLSAILTAYDINLSAQKLVVMEDRPLVTKGKWYLRQLIQSNHGNQGPEHTPIFPANLA